MAAARARANADVIDRMASDGDPVYTALLPVAADLRQAALEVEALPASFWAPASGSSPSPRGRGAWLTKETYAVHRVFCPPQRRRWHHRPQFRELHRRVRRQLPRLPQSG
ncbi:hypothetical protein [Streptomyces sp. 6N223]|uniref:hypothetical protein n=1 Tax=Streptomyces sp. 6N223 TaxID=3457412 RepID=UPI003FCFF246